MKYFEQVKIKDKRVQGFHYSRNMGEGGINPVKSPPSCWLWENIPPMAFFPHGF